MNRLGCAAALEPLGDAAVVLKFDCPPGEDSLTELGALANALEQELPRGVSDVVPAFATVTVFYDPGRLESFTELCGAIQRCARRFSQGLGGAMENSGTREAGASRLVEVPVCYGGEFGPDLEEVGKRAGLATEQVVALHREARYFVQAIGFAPGFAYLGGLPDRLHTPRRATPRTQVPAGALGIGGALTGVYPLATPGGWNLIGRTPLRMFDPTRREPALLRAGDRVRFHAITPEEFAAWK